MDRVKVGARLRVLRGEETLDAVANALGIGRTALNMYELGKRMPRDEVKVKLAAYYHKGVEEIFFAEDDT